MASSDWLPSKEADLANFLTPFSAKITATPTAYALTAADATALAGLLTSFKTSLALVNDPNTRTPTNVTAKDVAKASLVADVRSLARRIQANPAVTSAQKTDLGLPIHDAVPTPVPPPSTQPVLALTEIGNRSHTIRIADITTPTKRSKPVGAVGAEIFAWAGPNPPRRPRGLELQGPRLQGGLRRGLRRRRRRQARHHRRPLVQPQGRDGAGQRSHYRDDRGVKSQG